MIWFIKSDVWRKLTKIQLGIFGWTANARQERSSCTNTISLQEPNLTWAKVTKPVISLLSSACFNQLHCLSCFQSASSLLPVCSQSGFSLLSACFQHVFSLLPAYFQPAFSLLPAWIKNVPSLFLISACLIPPAFSLLLAYLQPVLCLVLASLQPALCLVLACLQPGFSIPLACFMPGFSMPPVCFMPASTNAPLMERNEQRASIAIEASICWLQRGMCDAPQTISLHATNCWFYFHCWSDRAKQTQKHSHVQEPPSAYYIVGSGNYGSSTPILLYIPWIFGH